MTFSSINYNGYLVHFRIGAKGGEYYVTLKSGQEFSAIDLAEVFEILKIDGKP